MLVDDLGVLAHFFIFLRHNIFALEILPDFDLVDGLEDASELLGVEIEFRQVGSSFPLRPVETCSEGVEEISQLVVLLISDILISLSEEWHVNLGDEGVQGPDGVLSDRGDKNLVLDTLAVDVFIVELDEVDLHGSLRWLCHLSSKTFERLAVCNNLKRLDVQFVQEHRQLRRCCNLCGQFRHAEQSGGRGGQILRSRIVRRIHLV